MIMEEYTLLIKSVFIEFYIGLEVFDILFLHGINLYENTQVEPILGRKVLVLLYFSYFFRHSSAQFKKLSFIRQ